MRYMFGLVGLLVTMAIVVTLFTNNAATVSHESKPAFEAAQQLAGQDENGNKAKDSIKLDGVFDANGKFRSIVVVQVDPAGPMSKHYGLQVDDQITEAGTFLFKDSDDEMSKEWVLKAYIMSQPLTILRDGKKMTLPFTR